MAVLKIITDSDCDLYIDQECICHLSSGKLHKECLPKGVYLIDVVDPNNDQRTFSFDLNVEHEDDQFLKRIHLPEIQEDVAIPHKSNMDSVDAIFYKDIGKVKENGLYGYINFLNKWILEP